MQNFQKNLAKLEAADTQVLGVSMDSPFSNAAWAEKEGFNFPILSDWGGEVTKQIGIYNPHYKPARRVTFLIDKHCKLAEMQVDTASTHPTPLPTPLEPHQRHPQCPHPPTP